MSRLGDAAELEKQGRLSEAADIYEALANLEGPKEGRDLYSLANSCRELAGQIAGHNYTAPNLSGEERKIRRIRRTRKDHFYTVVYILGAILLCYIVMAPFIAMGINK